MPELGISTVRNRLLLALALGAATPAFADEPRIWRDPNGGCSYVITPQGGIGLRYLRDGRPDCPDGPVTQIRPEAVAPSFVESRRESAATRYW